MLKNHTQESRSRSPIWRRRAGFSAAVLSGAILTLGTLGGCESAGEGLFTGAALGAVAGLVIGSANGDGGEGAALGAVLGGVAGSIIGDQNAERRRDAVYGSYEYRRDRGYRSEHPYCSTHHTNHTHRAPHRSNGHGYGHDDWWND